MIDGIIVNLFFALVVPTTIAVIFLSAMFYNAVKSEAWKSGWRPWNKWGV